MTPNSRALNTPVSDEVRLPDFGSTNFQHLPLQCRKMQQAHSNGASLPPQIPSTPFAGRTSSEVGIQAEALGLLLVSGRRHHARLLVLPDTLLEEVRLPLQGDQLHPIEGVRRAEE